jgi:hypothetical protein
MAFGKVSWVLSVPARGLALADVPGSVFDAEALLAMPLAPDLRRAVGLALRAHGGAGVPVRCVVRPEIFTHGRSLAWLKEKLGPVTDHLNLSDGTAVKLIPGLRNHMFTYGLHAQGHAQEFKKLLRRAPELLGQIQSQVNSFHRVVTQGMAIEPKATLLSAAAPEPAAPVSFHGFYMNPHSSEDSAENMLSWGEREGPKLAGFDHVTYIPLTECAARDAGFQRMVAEAVAETFFHPKVCLLIRVPAGLAELPDRLRVGIDGIRTAGLHLPQARAKNIFLVDNDLPEAALTGLGSRLSLVLHQSFEYWCYTRGLYKSADKVVYFLDADWKRPSETAKRLLREAFGQAPRFAFGGRGSDADGTQDS